MNRLARALELCPELGYNVVISDATIDDILSRGNPMPRRTYKVTVKQVLRVHQLGDVELTIDNALRFADDSVKLDPLAGVDVCERSYEVELEDPGYGDPKL